MVTLDSNGLHNKHIPCNAPSKTATIHKQPLTKNAVIVTAAVGCDGANTFTAKGVVTATTAATALGTFFVLFLAERLEGAARA